MKIAIIRGIIKTKEKYRHIHRDEESDITDHFSRWCLEMAKLDDVEEVSQIFFYKDRIFEYGKYTERYLKSYRDLKAYIAEKRPDTIIVLGRVNDIAIGSVLKGFKYRPKLMYYSRGLDPIPYNMELYDVVFGDTDYKVKLLNGIGGNNWSRYNKSMEEFDNRRVNSKYVTKFLRNGVDDRLWNPVKCKKEYDIVLVGRCYPTKGHRAFLKWMSKYTEKRLKILMIGVEYGGNYKELLKYKEHDVTMTGLMDRKKVNIMLSKCKIAVAPFGNDEGFPQVLMEYSMAGIPYVMKKGELITKQYHNEDTCVLSDDKHFMESTISLLDNYKEFNARGYAEKNIDLKGAVKYLVDLAKEI